MGKQIVLEKFLEQSAQILPNIGSAIKETEKNVRGKVKEWPADVPLPTYFYLVIEREEINKSLPVGEKVSAQAHLDFIKENNAMGSYRMIAALHTWKKSKNIYRFDPDLAQEIKKAKWDDVIHPDILERIPEEVFVLNIKNLFPEKKHLNNYSYLVVRKDYNHELKEKVICFLFQEEGDLNDINTTFYSYALNCCNIKDLHKTYMSEYPDSYINAFMAESFPEQTNKSIEEKHRFLQAEANEKLSAIMPFILYVCSYNPDIIKVTGDRQVKKNPEILRQHQIGTRVGQKLRSYKKAYTSTKDGSNGTKTKRPHFRVAHFRNQWYGSEKADDKKQKLIWVPPSYIHAPELSEAFSVGIKEFGED